MQGKWVDDLFIAFVALWLCYMIGMAFTANAQPVNASCDDVLASEAESNADAGFVPVRKEDTPVGPVYIWASAEYARAILFSDKADAVAKGSAFEHAGTCLDTGKVYEVYRARLGGKRA
jgi:hypothetical protein